MSATPSVDPSALPNPFGPYHILRRLGKGGMGTVYLAHDTRLHRDVALKVCHVADGNPQALERFHREARAAAALRHPNLCPVYDVGETAGICYITMAYIAGSTLADRLRSHGPFEPGQAVALIRRLAVAMQRAHDHGIIHRDLKPANIAFDQDGEPVVLDFGLARLEESLTPLTPDGAIVGTPAYMAPEQVSGQQSAIGPATDVYALGVILYELLTGRVPFTGSFSEVMGQILYGHCPTPRELRPELTPRLSEVCTRASARAVADRFSSMVAFAAALEALGMPAPPVPSVDVPLATTRDFNPVTAESPDTKVPETRSGLRSGAETPLLFGIRIPPPRRIRGRMVLGLFLLLLLGGLAIWFLISPEPQPNAARIPGLVAVLEGHSKPVVAVALSPDGRLALTGSWDNTARLWEVASATELKLWMSPQPTARVASVAFSADGKYAAVGLGGASPNSVRLLEVATKATLWDQKVHLGYVFALRFSADSRWLLSGGGDRQVILWEPEVKDSYQVPPVGKAPPNHVDQSEVKESGWIRAVGFAAAETEVVAVTGDGTVSRWSLAQRGHLPSVFRLPSNEVGTAALSADGAQVLLPETVRSFALWNIDNRSKSVTFDGHTSWVSGMAFSRDGRRVLSGSSDKTVKLWDALTGTELYSFEGHADGVRSVAISGDGRFALSGDSAGGVRVWRLPE